MRTVRSRCVPIGPVGFRNLVVMLLGRCSTRGASHRDGRAGRPLRDFIAVYDREIEMLERDIHQHLKSHSGYRAVQAINGVGPTIAAILVSEIGDVTRFPTAAHLCSWAGLTPAHHESDTKTRRGRITKQGSRLLRWALIEGISST